MKPSVIGIGVQKCMTSWVHALASAHPGIVASNPKELNFFSYYFDRGYRWYEAHFLSKNQTGIGFESSPSYFHDPRSPGRVAAYAPDMKIVVLLRDPVERAYSNHLHEVIKGHIPPCSFSEGLANNPSYLEQGRFATHLGRWLDHFPSDNLLCLISEEVAADLKGSAARIYAFAGVDPEHRSGVTDEKRNDSDRPRSTLLRGTLRASGDVLRRAGLEEALILLKKSSLVSGALRFNSVPMRAEIPPMTADDVERLRAIFIPEVARLAGLLGRDALPWPSWRYAIAEV